MVKCVFCGREESFHKGIHLIKNDGSIDYFCSSKCRKNALNLKRDKKRLKWTDSYRRELEKIAKRKILEEKKAEEKAIKKTAEKPSAEKKAAKEKPAKKAKSAEKIAVK
jgi:large subunit ribosomal protein L24e